MGQGIRCCRSTHAPIHSNRFGGSSYEEPGPRFGEAPSAFCKGTVVDRCAIFVDAGYVFAEGGKLCHGTRSRRLLKLDVSGVNGVLCELASSSCNLPVLRTYWYDGARDGIPSPSQQAIAALPNVKLRLGRLNAKNEQKGVDALIYRDLMTLARERAISEAFLLAGDEDLREGVRAAQDMGVRVTVVGIIPALQPFNQSRDLVTEADVTVQLSRDELSPFVERVEPPPPEPPVDAAEAAQVTDRPNQLEATAHAFAIEWWDRASESDRGSLAGLRPRIPKPLDVELLQRVETAHSVSLRGNDQLHRAVRRAFWAGITESARAERTSAGPVEESDA